MPVPSGALSLTEAADRLGVHYMTIYRYVRLGLLPARKEGGSWRVDESDLEGFRRPSDAPVDRGGTPWSERLEARLVAGDLNGAWGVIEAALAAGTEPDRVYVNVLAPALDSIGERWRSGELGIDDEHVASAVALRLIGRLGGRFTRRGRPRGVVITAMPPGERHGLGVSMLADVLRTRGYEVLDLGADTPPESLASALRKADRVDAVCLSVVYAEALSEVTEMVAAVRRVDPDLPVLIGGRAVRDEAHARELGADGWAADPTGAAELVEVLTARTSDGSEG